MFRLPQPHRQVPISLVVTAHGERSRIYRVAVGARVQVVGDRHRQPNGGSRVPQNMRLDLNRIGEGARKHRNTINSGRGQIRNICTRRRRGLVATVTLGEAIAGMVAEGMALDLVAKVDVCGDTSVPAAWVMVPKNACGVMIVCSMRRGAPTVA